VGRLEERVRALVIIPGATEFGYEPAVHVRDFGFGRSAPETRHTRRDGANFDVAMDEAQALCPNLESVSLVVAHNAAFDRPFCEPLWPEFASKAWACSLKEVDWAGEGFEGGRLCHIAAAYGFFFDAHRAEEDCYAGVEILTRDLPRSGRPVFAALLESARTPRLRVRAEGAPYGSRLLLKSRGYRWDASGKGGPSAWCAEVAEDALDGEVEFLRREVYRRNDAAIPHRRVTAFDRYSDR